MHALTHYSRQHIMHCRAGCCVSMGRCLIDFPPRAHAATLSCRPPCRPGRVRSSAAFVRRQSSSQNHYVDGGRHRRYRFADSLPPSLRDLLGIMSSAVGAATRVERSRPRREFPAPKMHWHVARISTTDIGRATCHADDEGRH